MPLRIPRRWLAGTALVFALLLALLSPLNTLAQPADSYESVIGRAVSEFDQSHWDEANALFRRAHSLNPTARTWRGLGLTSFELRRYVDAIAELEAARADPRKPLTAKLRSEVEDVLRRARDFVSVYRVRVTPSEAEVMLDGHPVELQDGTLMLDPGAHTISVRAPGYREREAQVRAAAGQKEEMKIELVVAEAPEPVVAAAPTQAPDPAPAAPPAPPPARPRYPWTIGLAAAAVVTGGVSVGLGVATMSKSDEASRCNREERENCGGIADSGQTLQAATNATIGVASVFAVGAVVAFFLERRGHSHGTEHSIVRLYPTGNGLAGSF